MSLYRGYYNLFLIYYNIYILTTIWLIYNDIFKLTSRHSNINSLNDWEGKLILYSTRSAMFSMCSCRVTCSFFRLRPLFVLFCGQLCRHAMFSFEWKVWVRCFEWKKRGNLRFDVLKLHRFHILCYSISFVNCSHWRGTVLRSLNPC